MKEETNLTNVLNRINKTVMVHDGQKMENECTKLLNAIEEYKMRQSTFLPYTTLDKSIITEYQQACEAAPMGSSVAAGDSVGQCLQ